MPHQTLDIVAQDAMDLFYQDYAPRDSFFDLPAFKRYFAQVYADLFDSIFQQFRKEGKQYEGFANVEMTANWIVKETVTVEGIEGDWYAKPTSCIFGFGYDSFSYALDNIKTNTKCHGEKPCTIIKLSSDEARFLDVSQLTGVAYAWLSAENKISITNNVKEVTIWYVPSVDADNGNCIVSQTIVAKCIRTTLDLMFGARNGTIVDETNDSNKVTTAQSQSNPTLNRA